MLSFLLMDTTTRRHCAEWTTCQTQKNEEICISLDDVFAKTRVWRIDVSQNVLFRRLKLRSSTSVLYCVGCWSSAYRPLLPSIHTGSAPCISRYDSSDICFAAAKRVLHAASVATPANCSLGDRRGLKRLTIENSILFGRASRR